MDQQQIEARVTLICECGCVRVREVIVALQQGAATPETEIMSAAERQEILRQLQSIMAIYDGHS
jgi:hypothetical protein